MITLELDDDIDKMLTNEIKRCGKTKKTYIKKLVKHTLESTEYILDEYLLNTYYRRLYDVEKNEIHLINKEYEVLAYLIKNRGNFVSADELLKNCWEEGKNPTIFSLRNIILNIREKTKRDAIVSKSNLGYKIN